MFADVAQGSTCMMLVPDIEEIKNAPEELYITSITDYGNFFDLRISVTEKYNDLDISSLSLMKKTGEYPEFKVSLNLVKIRIYLLTDLTLEWEGLENMYFVMVYGTDAIVYEEPYEICPRREYYKFQLPLNKARNNMDGSDEPPIR